MSNFSTYARRINEVLTGGDVKFISRSIIAIVSALVGNPTSDYIFLQGLAQQGLPLTATQIDAAKRILLRRYVGTLARLAVAADGKGSEPVPARPSALPAHSERKKAPRKAKAKKPEFATTPDKGGKAPWEHDDGAIAVMDDVPF